MPASHQHRCQVSVLAVVICLFSLPQFTQSRGIYSTGIINRFIPDAGGGSCTSTIHVPDSFTINPLTSPFAIYIRILHSFISDLQIHLTHVASGTTVRLFNRGCGSARNMDMTYDETSASIIPTSTCLNDAIMRVKPDQSLTAFNTLSANSNWTLTIEDMDPGIFGTLQEWSIQACGPGCETCTESFVCTRCATGVFWRGKCFSVCPAGTHTIGGSTCVDGYHTYPSGPLSLPIRDYLAFNTTITVPDNITVNASTFNVMVKVQHTYIFDLRLTLYHEASKISIWLFEADCDGAGTFSFVFSDRVVNPTPISCFSPIMPIKPFQPLSRFNGFLAQGNWTLSIVDLGTADEGTLLEWYISTCDSTCGNGLCSWPSGKRCGSACDDPSVTPSISADGALNCTAIPCGPNCATCVSTAQCSVCQPFYLLWNGACGLTCPNSTYAVNGSRCEACPSGCAECSTPQTCSACLPGFYFFSNTTCVATCPYGFYPSGSLCVASYRTYPSGILNAPIPEYPGTLVSTITLPSFTVNTGSNFKVFVRVLHEYLSDLRVSLTHGNTTVILFDHSCGSANNFRLTWYEGAVEQLPLPCPNDMEMLVKPAQPLSPFNGLDAAGKWNLTVADRDTIDEGILVQWGITACDQDCRSLCSDSGYTQCRACELGTSPRNSTGGAAGDLNCTACQSGKYDDGSHTCVGCPAGTYSQLVRAYSLLTCGPCPSGFWCPVASSQPTPCGIGHYNPVFNRASPCPVCPAGHYCPYADTDDPISCPAGRFNPSTGAFSLASCNICPAGAWCAAGSSAATPCGTGFYNPNTGSQSYFGVCLICPEGHYCGPSAMTETPIPCPVGTFTPITGGESVAYCQPCQAGTYCPNTGSILPTLCPAGYYCTGGNLITPCSQGTYNSFAGGTNSTVCLPCPGGSYCPSATVNPTICTAGRYCAPGSASATPCDPGTYNPATGGNSSAACLTCPQAAICPSGSIQPSYCSPGTYKFVALNATSPCSTCQPGRFCPAATTAETPCPPGTSNPDLGASACHDCLKGYYQASSGSTACTSCNLPTIPDPLLVTQNRSSRSHFDCKYCPNGYMVISDPVTQERSCGSCRPGWFCRSGEPAQRCPAGYYCGQGTTEPTPCPTGQTSQPSSNSVSECKPAPSDHLFCVQSVCLTSDAAIYIALPSIGGFFLLCCATCCLCRKMRARKRQTANAQQHHDDIQLMAPEAASSGSPPADIASITPIAVNPAP